MPAHRFSAWDGTQDPLGSGLDDLFGRLGEDVLHGWDFDTALRRMLGQGWTDARGSRHQGLDELMDQLRARHRQQLERFNLGGVFKDIQEKIDNVLRQERRGIDDRVASATDESAQRVLDRVAAKRRATLDNLPAEPGGAIRELQHYEFMDQGAEQSFRQLLEEMKEAMTDQYFADMATNMRNMTSAEMAGMREMLDDLNHLLDSHIAGRDPGSVQTEYEMFKAKWTSLFPDAPPTFPEFLDQLLRRLAQMDSLMQSLPPEMRQQLADLADSVFGDAGLQDQFNRLAGALATLSPHRRPGQRYRFFGDEELPLDQAMELMASLQSMEELEQSLHRLYRGEHLDDVSRRQLRDLLGDGAGDSVDQLERAIDRLEQAGLVESADGKLVQLTARGARRIGHRALNDLFAKLKKDQFGNHPVHREGGGGERGDETKSYEYGDVFDLDVEETVMNAVRRESSGRGATRGRGTGRTPQLDKDDFAVHRTEATTRSSTVLMLDMSRSMPLRGYFYAAKKVAMALDALIRTQFPRDRLHIIGFSDYAREISGPALAGLSVNEYVYGTNLQHGLMVARRLLARDHGASKQIIIVSDGEPTAHMEGSEAVFCYPPLPETLRKTLFEVQRCTKDDITINTFMLESNQHLVQFVNRMTQLNHGRAFFISPDRLGEYVLVDYARRRGSAA